MIPISVEKMLPVQADSPVFTGLCVLCGLARNLSGAAGLPLSRQDARTAKAAKKLAVDHK
jgi:hypothetical protein